MISRVDIQLIAVDPHVAANCICTFFAATQLDGSIPRVRQGAGHTNPAVNQTGHGTAGKPLKPNRTIDGMHVGRGTTIAAQQQACHK